MVKMTLRRHLWCLVQLAVGTLSTSEYLNIPNAINLSVIIQYITWEQGLWTFTACIQYFMN